MPMQIRLWREDRGSARNQRQTQPWTPRWSSTSSATIVQWWQIERSVRHFRKLGVSEFGVWNEENHVSQPTYKNAGRAAAYYRTLRSICHHCTIVALDVLDQRGVQGYISRWFRALPRSYRHSRIYIGIHNYSDTNRLRSRGTSAIIRAARGYNAAPSSG